LEQYELFIAGIRHLVDWKIRIHYFLV